MSQLKEDLQQRLAQEVERLRRDNEELLRELENAYAQLTAVMQVSQDETRIAYSELQEKVVVLEKKLVELSFLSGVGDALLAEIDLAALRRLIVEKICLILPADLVSLHLVRDLGTCTQRERDVVREVALERPRLASLRNALQRLERDGAGPLLVADLDLDPEDAVLRLRADARSAACVPLRAGHLLGALVLNSRLRANFREDQEALLGAFGSQAAAALENALRVQRHQDLLVKVMRVHGLSAAELLRCERLQLDVAAQVEAQELRRELRVILAEDRGARTPLAPTPPPPEEDS